MDKSFWLDIFSSPSTLAIFSIGVLSGIGVAAWFFNYHYSSFKNNCEKLIQSLEKDVARKSEDIENLRANINEQKQENAEKNAEIERLNNRIGSKDALVCKACSSSMQFVEKKEEEYNNTYIFKCTNPRCGLVLPIDEYSLKQLHIKTK